jgi:hypothetical protein
VGFVAQDTPAYAALSVTDHLHLGAWLNPHWDSDLAERRIELLGLDPRQRAGKLSGGQRAQLALTLAIAKRPEILILDEPVASLDPLARREFLQGLLEVVAEHGVSVVLPDPVCGPGGAADHHPAVLPARIRPSSRPGSPRPAARAALAGACPVQRLGPRFRHAWSGLTTR